MNKMKAFTLIELLITLAILSIIGASIAGGLSGGKNYSCQGGYKFTQAYKYKTQILDEHGHGIPCDGY